MRNCRGRLICLGFVAAVFSLVFTLTAIAGDAAVNWDDPAMTRVPVFDEASLHAALPEDDTPIILVLQGDIVLSGPVFLEGSRQLKVMSDEALDRPANLLQSASGRVFVLGPGASVTMVWENISLNQGEAPGGGIQVGAGASLVLDAKDSEIGRVKTGHGTQQGAVYGDRAAQVQLSGLTVWGSVFQEDGGGLYFNDCASVQLSGCVLSDNRVEGTGANGGALALYACQRVSIVDCVLEGNRAEGSGGGIYAARSQVAISGETVIADNQAEGSGGGIYTAESTLHMDGSAVTLKGNQATLFGGGLYAQGGSVTLQGFSVRANEAQNGGGLAFRGSADVTLSGLTLGENRAGLSGGALYAEERDLPGIRMYGLAFEGNEALDYVNILSWRDVETVTALPLMGLRTSSLDKALQDADTAMAYLDDLGQGQSLDPLYHPYNNYDIAYTGLVYTLRYDVGDSDTVILDENRYGSGVSTEEAGDQPILLSSVQPVNRDVTLLFGAWSQGRSGEELNPNDATADLTKAQGGVITLYANYRPASHTVTFLAGGSFGQKASFSEDSPAPWVYMDESEVWLYVPHGEAAFSPEEFLNAPRVNMCFLGWYDWSAWQPVSLEHITKDLTLEAQWGVYEENINYVLEFYVRDRLVGREVANLDGWASGPDDGVVPTGYRLEGWVFTIDGEEQPWLPDQTILYSGQMDVTFVRVDAVLTPILYDLNIEIPREGVHSALVSVQREDGEEEQRTLSGGETMDLKIATEDRITIELDMWGGYVLSGASCLEEESRPQVRLIDGTACELSNIQGTQTISLLLEQERYGLYFYDGAGVLQRLSAGYGDCLIDFGDAVPQPNWPGKVFLGWEDGNGSPWYGDDPITGDLLLTARYGIVYSLYLDSNDGTGDRSRIKLLNGASLAMPVLEGEGGIRLFLGWAYEPDGLEIAFLPGETYAFAQVFGLSPEDNTRTLYGVWETMYTLHFDSGDGSESPEPQTLRIRDSVTMPVLEGEGGNRLFLGWAYGPDGEEADFLPGGTYAFAEVFGPSPEDSALLLYAVWGEEEIEPPVVYYTLYFDLNDGSGTALTAEIQEGSPIEMPRILGDADGTRTFLGWALASESKTADYGAGQAYSFQAVYGRVNTDKPLTLYAVWKVKETGKGTSGGGGGSSQVDRNAVLTVEYRTEDGSLIQAVSSAETTGSLVIVSAPLLSGYTLVDEGAKTIRISATKENIVVFTYRTEGAPITATEEQSGAQYVTLEREKRIAYLTGYEDGTIRPDEDVTRAQVAVLLYRLVLDEEKTKASKLAFSDTEPDAWYGDALSYLADQGILSGYGDGSFRPDSPMTRAEFAALLSRFGSLLSGPAEFTDLDHSHWARIYVENAYGRGWISGFTDGSFRPESAVTRAQAVAMVNRMLVRAGNPDGFTGEDNPFTDLKQDHWAFPELLEAALGEKVRP